MCINQCCKKWHFISRTFHIFFSDFFSFAHSRTLKERKHLSRRKQKNQFFPSKSREGFSILSKTNFRLALNFSSQMMFLGRKKSNNHIQLLAQFSKSSTSGWRMFSVFFASHSRFIWSAFLPRAHQSTNETGLEFKLKLKASIIISSKQDQWLNRFGS